MAPLPSRLKSSRYASQRGMALLIVLAVLLLVTVLIVGFFLSTTSELKSSQSYASGAGARQLSESVTQIVIAQITDATKGQDDAGKLLAWASQPGMIRTYNEAGEPSKYYKLYSSSSLLVSGTDLGSFSPTSEATPSGWNTQTGLFTDLNNPIIRDGKVHFPIIDPRAKSATAGQSVEGFDYTEGVTGVVLPSAGADSQRLPMPVRWLYVLQDGKLATPSSGTTTVSFDSAKGAVPSTGNPIVGRIAFWTDDESSKININTASEGTFWDRPWANNTTEQNLATAIPGQNEFQRYPGHPAKTSLSTVLGPLLPSPSPSWYNGMANASQAQNQLKAYYDLAPRVADGGTRGGTVNEGASFQAVSLDGDRLYASVDEFLFSPVFSTKRTSNNTLLTNTALEKTKFFLTAHSRAPEINLFGRPRMTLWPLQADRSERNAKDKLIAFCSEIGGQSYYFQRAGTYPGNPSSQSPTADWLVDRNQQLYSYLNDLTSQPVPGFGGSFSSKYPSSRKQLLTEMFDQIRSGVNVYSTALSPAYSYAPPFLFPGEGQVVPLVPTSGPAAGTHGFGRFSTVVGSALVFFRANNAYYHATPDPAAPTDRSKDKVETDAALKTPDNPNGVVIKPAAQIGATLILNPFSVSPGFPPWSPYITYVVTGLDKFTINNKSMGFPATLTNTVSSRVDYSGQGNVGSFFGLLAAFRTNAPSGGDLNKTAGNSNPNSQYPFTIPVTGSPAIQLLDGDKAFDFNTDDPSGHSIRIMIYAGASGNLIQTIDMNFPPVNGLPIPTEKPIPLASFTPAPPNIAVVPSYFNRFNEGVTAKTLSKRWRQSLIQGYPIPRSQPPYTSALPAMGVDANDSSISIKYWVRDVVRGVEGNAFGPAKGDYRVYAALNYVPPTYFSPCPGYNSLLPSGIQEFTNVQSLLDYGRDGGGTGGFGYDKTVPGGVYDHFALDQAGSSNDRGAQLTTSFTTGVLIPQGDLAEYGGAPGRGSNVGDREYRGSARPAVPRGLLEAKLDNDTQPGDWDNTPGLLGDGPFINKPDEGNSSTISKTSSTSNIDVYSGGADIGGGYFSTGISQTMETEFVAESGATFSPNRQVSSAVLFGSLPTGIDPGNPGAVAPWQTLLFSPNPQAKSAHPGVATPPDHLFLDLFTMPIIEPYAISEPFSTAGKINMNYQIMPFTYIRRSTGVRAVLKATRIMAIPQKLSTVTAALGNSYKDAKRGRFEFRYDINPDESEGTLRGFENRFNDGNGDIFRSASEICSIFLVPKKMAALSTNLSYPAEGTPPSSYAATAAWWNDFKLTGDNTREFPYGDLYARLTTKSNTYTVHYKVQTLKKLTATAANQWIEARDLVVGEMRGSTTIERYIDLGDPNLPDFANSSSPSAEGFYKFHSIRSTVFNP